MHSSKKFVSLIVERRQN